MRLLLLMILAMLIPVSSAAVDWTEEDMLAMEITGELLPPPDEVARITHELDLIREFEPKVASIHKFPSWEPGWLRLDINELAEPACQGNSSHEIYALIWQYLEGGWPLVDCEWRWGYMDITFQAPYNTLRLADEFEALDSVDAASAGDVYGDGDDITMNELGHYIFKRGWGDCPAGCDGKHYWEFQVDGDDVTLVQQYGSVPVSADGVSLLKARY